MDTSQTKSNRNLIGEIVEVDSTSFFAQCYSPNHGEPPCLLDPPDFGSFVKIGPAPANDPATIPTDDSETDPFEQLTPRADVALLDIDQIYAVVTHARMAALDAGRRATALGFDDHDKIRFEQPQIFELLTTEFAGALVGFSDAQGRLRRHLPPKPPRIHAQVFECTIEETLAITEDLQFLQPILAAGHAPGGSNAPVEQLVAAIIRRGQAARGGDPSYLRLAGTTIAAMVGGDYNRLQAIMRSITG